MTEETRDVGAEDAPQVDDAAEAPTRELPADPILRSIAEAVESAVASDSLGDDVLRVDKADLAAAAQAARDAGFEMCVDVTAVDFHRDRRIRFDVVVSLLSHEHNRRLRLLAAVPAADPSVPTLVPVYPGTNFFEREVYDMFGITFEGHPDLTRILMPDDWNGHPLRKDFAVGAVPVQFKEAHQVQ